MAKSASAHSAVELLQGKKSREQANNRASPKGNPLGARVDGRDLRGRNSTFSGESGLAYPFRKQGFCSLRLADGLFPHGEVLVFSGGQRAGYQGFSGVFSSAKAG